MIVSHQSAATSFNIRSNDQHAVEQQKNLQSKLDELKADIENKTKATKRASELINSLLGDLKKRELVDNDNALADEAGANNFTENLTKFIESKLLPLVDDAKGLFVSYEGLAEDLAKAGVSIDKVDGFSLLSCEAKEFELGLGGRLEDGEVVEHLANKTSPEQHFLNADNARKVRENFEALKARYEDAFVEIEKLKDQTASTSWQKNLLDSIRNSFAGLAAFIFNSKPITLIGSAFNMKWEADEVIKKFYQPSSKAALASIGSNLKLLGLESKLPHITVKIA